MQPDTLEALAKAFEQKALPESEVEFSGDIPYEHIEPLKQRALEHFAKELELPGFRKGHVPLDMVQKKVGDIALLEEAVELFMRDFYPALVQTREVDAIGRPEIRITKLAPGNPVGILIRAATYPEVALPKGWKDLSTKVPEELVPSVKDREIDEALESIRRAHAKAASAESSFEASPRSPAAAETDAAEAATEEKTKKPNPTDPVPSEQLPDLNDDFARTLGSFVDLSDLKAKMRENLVQEKAQKARDARRGKIVEKLLEDTKLAVPAIFVDSELEKILAQMRDDITRYGLTFEDYLSRINKTEEDVRNEMRDQARSRAKLQLILNKIAQEEKIEADKEAVESEMKHALEHFPDARQDLVRIHIETVLRNEKVLQLLEGAEPEKKEDESAAE